MRADGSFIVEDADIRWLNFAGRIRDFNPNGDRTFCLFINKELAKQLLADDYNVKITKPRKDATREEIADFTPEDYIEVKVGYKIHPPRITMRGETTGKKTELTEDTCEILDEVDIASVDVIVRPRDYDINGKTGIKAYLKRAVVVIEEDFLDLKWADIDDKMGVNV